MMGQEHALVGFGTYAAGTWALTTTGYIQAQTAPALAAGALLAAGAALLPDIDHPSATVANAGGIVTKGIARITNAVSGGHRQGTHQVPFAVVLFVLVWGTTAGAGKMAQALGMPELITYQVHITALWFISIVAFGVQATSKTFLHQRFNKLWQQRTGTFAKAYSWGFAALAFGATWLLCGSPSSWSWVVPAVITGHLSHLVTDAFTSAGLSILPGVHIYLPILGEAKRENPLQLLLGVAFALVGIVTIVATALGQQLQLELLPFSFGSLV